MFVAWAKEHGLPLDNVVIDGTFTNQTRLGAIKDIQLALHKMPDQGRRAHLHQLLNRIKTVVIDDVMVLGGDTLFFDVDLNPIVDDFNARPDCSLVRSQLLQFGP